MKMIPPSLALNLGIFAPISFVSVRRRLVKQTRQKMPPKWKAARSSEHIAELLLLLAFSKVSVFIAEQCERKGKTDAFPSAFNGICSKVNGA